MLGTVLLKLRHLFLSPSFCVNHLISNVLLCGIHSYFPRPLVAFIPSANVLLWHSFLLPIFSCCINSFCHCPPVALYLSVIFPLVAVVHFVTVLMYAYIVFTFLYLASPSSSSCSPVASLLLLSLFSCGIPPFPVSVLLGHSSSSCHCSPLASLLFLSLYSCGIPPPLVTVLLWHPSSTYGIPLMTLGQ